MMNSVLHGLIVLLVVKHNMNCKGISSLTLSKNPVYKDQPVTLTCQLLGDDFNLLSGWIDVLNNNQKEGTLFCRRKTGTGFTNEGSGQFSGYSFIGCSNIDVQRPLLSVSVVASLSWDRNYQCTFEVMNSTVRKPWNVTSTLSHLSVYVLPKAPTLDPSGLVFNETAFARLSCESKRGTPPAAIVLTVTQQHLGNCNQTRGLDSVSLILQVPLKNWHNAKVTCTVKNHNFSDNTASGIVRINYIANHGALHVEVDTQFTNETLNCSARISCFPEAKYRWSTPPEANISKSASLNSPVLIVPQGQTGLFICTATNIVTVQEVVIIYDIKAASTVPANPLLWTSDAVMCVVIIVIAGVVIFICRRKHCRDPKRREDTPLIDDDKACGIDGHAHLLAGTKEGSATAVDDESPQLFIEGKGVLNPSLNLSDEQQPLSRGAQDSAEEVTENTELNTICVDQKTEYHDVAKLAAAGSANSLGVSRTTSKEELRCRSRLLRLRRKRRKPDCKELEEKFRINRSLLVEQLARTEVAAAAFELWKNGWLLEVELETIFRNRTEKEAACSLTDFIIKKDMKELYMAFLDILEKDPERRDLVGILTSTNEPSMTRLRTEKAGKS